MIPRTSAAVAALLLGMAAPAGAQAPVCTCGVVHHHVVHHRVHHHVVYHHVYSTETYATHAAYGGSYYGYGGYGGYYGATYPPPVAGPAYYQTYYAPPP